VIVAKVASVFIAVMTLALAGSATATAEGIHNIQHVVVVMQENRSFDHYFGTYPGANGIPASVCEPDPLNGGCLAPFHDPSNVNTGGPHGAANALAAIDEGRMDGFIGQAEQGQHCSSTEPGCSPCRTSSSEACLDVMGYHDAREIPNYWTYAENYALQDNLFSSARSWSLPEHLFMVSGWSAACPDGNPDPMECKNTITPPNNPDTRPAVSYSWTDITYLLHKYGVSWAYYVFKGTEPDCESDEAVTCAPVAQSSKTPGIWNPLPNFTDVKDDSQVGNVQTLANFYTAVHQQPACGLPNVSWVTPNGVVSEHPTESIVNGQAYVTTLVNAIMRSPCWNSTAIFISWDDWGGFYDHVVPPEVDENGYGLRVPGLVISPYAKAGYIDHQQLSHDAYLKFIEDDFLSGQRLNKQDGRPDPRRDVREGLSGLGNLEADFNFNQEPRPPLLLPTHPLPGPPSNPPGFVPPVVAPPTPMPMPTPTPTLSPVTPQPSTTNRALQLVVSVAGRQSLHSHRGRITFALGCNVACDVYIHGHLSLTQHRRRVELRSLRFGLAADHDLWVGITLSHAELAGVRSALRHHRSVDAIVKVDATGASDQSYLMHVRLMA
jgi:phospholipase C